MVYLKEGNELFRKCSKCRIVQLLRKFYVGNDS